MGAFNPHNKNLIFAGLPSAILDRLGPLLEDVDLPHGKVLYQPDEAMGHVYFPYNSLVSPLASGQTVEVGLVGIDGMVGITALMGEKKSPNRAIVQIPDGGAKAKLSSIREEFERGGEFQARLLRYASVLLRQVSQTAACNATHPVEERLARWLLMSSDRVRSEHLNLTQEFISEMIATRRATVSTAASALQVKGLIEYRRGQIRILDHKGLEKFACECYKAANGNS